MKISTNLLLSVILACGPLCAAQPTVARVTSSEPLEVRGVAVDMKGLASWPVTLDDDIATRNAEAYIQFQDGSTVSLQKHSRVKIQGSKDDISVRVLSGSIAYSVTPRSQVHIIDAAGAVLQNSARNTRSFLPTSSVSSSGIATPSSSGTRSGIVFAPKAVSVGTINAAANGSGSTQIILPDGTRFNVTVGPNNQLTITSIDVPVTTPNGTDFVKVTSGPLVGATVTADIGSSSEQPLKIIPSGSTTPLMPQQIATALQQSADAAITAAVQSGQLPQGTVKKPTSPVGVGTVSSSAP